MAKRTTVPARPPARVPARVPARRVTNAPAVAAAEEVEFVVPPQTGNTPDAALPAGWTEENAEEAPSSLTPAADWQHPGQYFSGEYLGRQEQVGPNKSRLYAFKAGDGSAVSIWGSTALDARMDFLSPARGEMMLIQFLGAVPTSRGLSDVKTFRVMRRR